MTSQNEWLLQIAGDRGQYPTAREAVNRLVGAILRAVPVRYGGIAPTVMVRELLAELTRLEIEGLITASDEHEYARWALIAGELANLRGGTKQ